MAETGGVLERLRRLRGIAPGFTDYQGHQQVLSADALRRLLTALGHEGDETALQQQADALDERDWVRVLPPVVVLRGEAQVPFTVLTPLLPYIRWRIATEQGELLAGQCVTGELPVLGERGVRDLWYRCLGLPLPALPPGYHQLALEKEDGSLLGATTLIIAPPRGYQPPAIAAGERLWGVAIQLYTLRSARNWGIGDFSDLAGFAAAAAALGADAVGLNPLHALFPADPGLYAPYSPSSRQFLNVLYIDPEAIPEYRHCTRAQRLVGAPEFQARLDALRAAPFVDYPGVTACKLEVLQEIFRTFDTRTSRRRRAFNQFLDNNKEEIEKFALFHSIHSHFMRAGQAGGWLAWPADYRDPGGKAARAWLAAEPASLKFHCWLQWIAAEQLAAAAAAARRAGMRIGLYQDLAVGPNCGGAETWTAQELYVTSASIGAPPDELAPQGQDWGIPPMHPERLREAAYAPFVKLLRANMPLDGALRIDHVMMLHRLWWVPEGRPSAEGGYVHYPLDELMAIVALESQRRRCLVIGEDLGTVPPEVREAMQAHGLFSYRVLYFEREPDGRFRAPATYPREALVTIGTHDLPPLASFWRGSDISLRERLGLDGGAGEAERERVARARTRLALLQALAREGLWDGDPAKPVEFGPELLDAVQSYLARTPSALLMLQPEDWLGMATPVNVPGTHDAYPNWARKLTADWPDFMATAGVRALAAHVCATRRGEEGT
jgi:4-alpha-glucanotransferase